MGIADGKRALVIGVANEKSLAWSIAQELKAQGAELALTYQGEVLEKRVRPLAAQLGASVVGELDVGSDAQIVEVAESVENLAFPIRVAMTIKRELQIRVGIGHLDGPSVMAKKRHFWHRQLWA